MPEDVWSKVVVPLAIALLGAAVAVLWPWLQARQRARRFQKIIARELREIAPQVDFPAGLPWWRYLSQRFVHEEIFARSQLSQNRDFLLTLHPDVLYGVSQLWIAYDKRDSAQWLHFLRYLSRIPALRSRRLDEALVLWEHVINDPGTPGTAPRIAVDKVVFDWGANLFDARLKAYKKLLELTLLPVGETADLRARASALTSWYYEDGNGLLLGGDSMRAWVNLRDGLVRRGSSADQAGADGLRPDLEELVSDLRTCLKVDLGVRHADERYVPLGF